MLEQENVNVGEQVDSRKEKIGREGAIELARSVNKIWAARGKKITVVDLKKDDPSDDDLAKILLGPTGNLRAPTIRKGKKLFVGFNEDELKEQMLS